MLAEAQDHLAAGLGPSCLQEAHVPGGDLRLDRELQLAEPPALPPLPEKIPEWPLVKLRRGHVPTVPSGANTGDYP
ncbi:hypothetical protein Pth03_06350 [Planotetraspora thailandica]|uniref:Uncharacterized protein n=1 Tax=Planotetraspora thailandica TaxID=487172 RepID=A0A8J3UZD5_9ACTN|nr:hypothetical protein Pth03_06350 [Planotetraspora thailandica]